MSDGEVTVNAVIRDRFRHYAPASYSTLQAGDVLILQAEPAALERLVARAKLELGDQGRGAGGHRQRRGRRDGGGGDRRLRR